ncbi:7149_t:CDS:2 [Diversispora eburnea]|uniref:7149_t:CDS:1 n=1 Tax=Diversispora eburnea TaxID=1213867 RepID=A0A9N8V106_9GLOM|nr:7149_t:CDS:2 [Diversispora eburnea]
MNSLRRLRNSLKRSNSKRGKNNQTFIYTPLPDGKLGYIIEHRQNHQIFYYKYRENLDGTLTKYGYVINNVNTNDRNNNNGGHVGHGHGEHRVYNKSYNSSSNKISKELWSNKDKDCIFYQTVADKTQIELERRWLNEIKIKGRLEMPTIIDDEDSGEEYKEWVDILQHNNKVYVSDSIQRRRVAEVLSNVEKCCGMNNNNLDNHDDNEVERRLGLNQLPPLTTAPLLPIIATQIKTNPSIANKLSSSSSSSPLNPHNSPLSRPKQAHINHKSTDSVSTTPLTSLPQHVLKNYIVFTPPISPQTPPSTPIDLINAAAASQNSLININVRKRGGSEKQRQLKRFDQLEKEKERKSENSDENNDFNYIENEQDSTTSKKPKKLIQLIHPKFSRNPPQVHIFDPEDSLFFKNCRCEHCLIGDYNE